MGKKGTKRKTRWRVLPIGEDGGGSGSGNEDESAGNEADCTTGTYARATQSSRGGLRRPGTAGGGNNRQYNNRSPQRYHNNYQPRSYHNNTLPVVTTEKQIFNEEEYTKITTPRQDVLFKKGYLGRKKAVVVEDTPVPSSGNYTNDNTHLEEMLENEPNDMCEEQPQFIYTNGFVDQTGVYYINGSGYEMYDPYSGNITVLVGPHYPANGGPPVLAAVPCQPVPLQQLEWFNPPGFLPYVTAPCHNNRDRRKRYSTDSQNCSPQSSESTGPPGSPQESDEVAVPGGDCSSDPPPAAPMLPPPQPPPPGYIYPGYMFGAPMYNMNGVTVQSTPNQAPCSDVAGCKRRKKKRRRRRKRNGVEDGSEESSSDEKEPEDDLLSPAGHESSLESDSKHSVSSNDLPLVEAPLASSRAQAVEELCTQAVHRPTHAKEESAFINGESKSSNEVSKLVNGDSQLTNGISRLISSEIGRSKLVNGENSLVNGTSKLARGECKLSNGVSHLSNGGNNLVNGGNKLVNGGNSLVNGCDKPNDKSSPVTCNGSFTVATVETDAAFESYENIINGFIKEELEDEWITVKAKGSQGKKTSEVTNGGVRYPAELTNGHAKPYKEYKREDYSRVNGNRKLCKDKKESKVKSVEVKGKGKMDGNEKDVRNVVPKASSESERKLSSSSSDGSRDPPAKPSRSERKLQKNVSPRKSPEVVSTVSKSSSEISGIQNPISVHRDVESRQESKTIQKLMVENLPEVQSLKELSSKSIPQDFSSVAASRTMESSPTKSSIEITAEFLRHEVEHKESNDSNDQNALLCEFQDVAPVAPPRRKKTWRQAQKRSPSPAAADESSSSSSQESVIECLSSGINSPEAGNDTPGLSSEDDEQVIYTGKLGITEPEKAGILKLTKPTIQVKDDKVLNSTIEEQTDSLPRVSESAEHEEAHLWDVQQAAVQLVDSVISASLEEATLAFPAEPNEAIQDKETEIPTQLGITDAVTRWLRSQSPDVLSCPAEDLATSESDEEENQPGSKNLHRNPLRVPSVNHDESGRRVANKSTEQCNNNEEDNESIEWDYHYGDNTDDKTNPLDHILCHAPISPNGTHSITPEYILLTNEQQLKYDPLANDTFASVESTLLDRVESCAEMCDPSVSVAKYYVLGARFEKSPETSLAVELARLEQPLPESWAVAPIRCPAEKAGESGGAFKRKLGGRLTGEGNPFPCGGVCCIVQ